MKTRLVLSAVALGVGLAVTLLLSLSRPTLIAGGGPGIYYVREGAAGDCLAVTTPCGSVQYAINLATTSGNEVWVATGTYTENLVITRGIALRGGWNISFTVQAPATYPTTIDGRGGYVISVTTGANLWRVEGFALRNGNDGIHVEGAATTLVLIGNVVYSTTSQGIEVVSGTVWIEGNTIYSTTKEGIKVNAGNATVVRNVVHDVHGAGQHGILVQANGIIRGNQVYHITGRGIDVQGGTAVVADNLVYDTGNDGIRSDDTSTGVEIRGNTVYGAGNDGIDARGATVLVAGNIVTGCTDNGIKSEGINQWVRIEGNWVLNNATVGIAIRQGPVFTITNNVVGDQISSSIELGGTGVGFVYHNTLVGSGVGTQGSGLAILSPLAATIVNNVVVSHTTGITAAGATLVVSHTLLWGNSSDPISGEGVIAQVPLFVAPVSWDYHLMPNSPAVNAGVDVGVRTDVDGEPRLDIPDIGADEVVRKVYLPLTVRRYPLFNRLRNPGFEGIACNPNSSPGWCDDNWTRDTHDGGTYLEIFTPQGWVTWWRTGVGYGRPETRVVPKLPPFINPPRIRSGNYAALLFTFYRLQDTGLYQVMTGLTPGTTVQFSAYAHGWSCDQDNPMKQSCGDLWNQTFQVGIEPDGLADPFSPSIIWSPEQVSPDTYRLIGPATAQVGNSGSVVVYLRSKTRWAYKHGNAYWDDAVLTVQSP